MFTVADIDNHLIGMGHSSSLNKIRNKEEMYERAATTFSLKTKTLEQMRTMPLASAVYDDFYNYALPLDFGSIIDLFPEANRKSWDDAYRTDAGIFDLQKAFTNRTISLEGNEGLKMLRVNWKSRQGKTFSSMNSASGWTAVGSAQNIEEDTITSFTGQGAVRFDVVASGDGIQNIALSTQDFTNENGVANIFVWLYFPSIANLTSVTLAWGNDLTTKFWTGAAQSVQVDGSAFRVGWNLISCPWATAVQTGIVDPTTIDSFSIAIQSTGAIAKVRADSVVFSIGRAFDLKYYSKYMFKDATTGLWISKPNENSTDDFVLVDNDTLPVFLMELLQAMAHQTEGSDSTFDINYAQQQMKDLYPIIRSQTPSIVKPDIRRSTSGPRMRRYPTGWRRGR